MHLLNRELERLFPDALIERVYLDSINYPFRRREARRVLAPTPEDLPRCIKYIDRYRPPPFDEVLRCLSEADVVVINGEGSMIEAKSHTRMVYTIIELASRRGIPVHLINFTAHITTGSSEDWASYSYGQCAAVCVREPLSYDVVRRFEPRVKLFPDLALGLDLDTSEMFDPCLLIGSGSAATRMERDPERTHRLRIAYNDLCVRLASHVPVRLMGWHRDEWLREIVGTGITYHDIDFVRYSSFCKSALLNFTGRHHGCVMSASVGCPFLTTTANCYKNFGDAELYGSAGPVMEMERLDVEFVESTVLSALDRANELRAKAESRRDQLRPFSFGAIRNIGDSQTDLVGAGLVSLDAEMPIPYIQHKAA